MGTGWGEGAVIPDTQSDIDAEAKKDAVFIEQYRLTGDAITACVRAGIRDPSYPITVMAQRQLQRPEIKAALLSLEKIDSGMVPLEVGRESIIADMESLYERCVTDGQYNAAIGCKKLQSLLLGLLDQKITVTHGFQPDKMTDEQLMRIASGNAKDVTSKIIEVDDE